jgi:hypothetical protein
VTPGRLGVVVVLSIKVVLAAAMEGVHVIMHVLFLLKNPLPHQIPLPLIRLDVMIVTKAVLLAAVAMKAPGVVTVEYAGLIYVKVTHLALILVVPQILQLLVVPQILQRQPHLQYVRIVASVLRPTRLE